MGQLSQWVYFSPYFVGNHQDRQYVCDPTVALQSNSTREDARSQESDRALPREIVATTYLIVHSDNPKMTIDATQAKAIKESLLQALDNRKCYESGLVISQKPWGSKYHVQK